MSKRTSGGASFQVQVIELDNGWVHLVIAFPVGLATAAQHRWGTMQHIKTQAVGAEREAFELYPAASRALIEGNERHLFVLPKGVKLPVGSTRKEILAWGKWVNPPQGLRDTVARLKAIKSRP